MLPEQHQMPRLDAVRKIAIVRALFLGDLLMTTPAWRALRRRFPQAEITLISLPWAASFMRHVPELIDRFVAFPGYAGLPELPYDPARTAAFLAEQRAYGYDLALQMHGNGTTTNGLLRELGAAVTAGHACAGDARLDLALPWDDRADRNEVLRWLELAGALGAPTDEQRVEFQLGPTDEAAAEAALAEREGAPLVGLHLGAKDAIRRWPVRQFAALGAALRRHCGAALVLTGSAHERDLTEQMLRLSLVPPLDLAGRTDVGGFAAVVKRLDLLVTNDTGASHIAAAVGTPSVVIFGPTRPSQFAPLDRELHRVVDALEHATPGVDGAWALEQLPIEPVLDAALAQLARQGRRTANGLVSQAVGGKGARCGA